MSDANVMSSQSCFGVGEARIISTERIELPIGPDNVSAAAVNAIFVPGPGVHKGFNHDAEGHAPGALHRLEQFAQLCVIAAAPSEVFERVMHFILKESLEFRKIQEVADMINAAVAPDEIADDRAVGIAARQRREVCKAKLTLRMLH